MHSVFQLANDLERRDESFSDLVNIGGGTPVSIEALINEIQEQTGRAINIVPSSEIKADVKITEADPSYLTSLIGTSPQIDLQTGIEKTLRWSTQENIVNRLSDWSGM